MTLATDRTTFTGETAELKMDGTYRINGIWVDNPTGASVTVQISDEGGGRIIYITAPGFSNSSMEHQYIADRGVQLNNAPGMDVQITVFHGATGS